MYKKILFFFTLSTVNSAHAIPEEVDLTRIPKKQTDQENTLKEEESKKKTLEEIDLKITEAEKTLEKITQNIQMIERIQRSLQDTMKYFGEKLRKREFYESRPEDWNMYNFDAFALDYEKKRQETKEFSKMLEEETKNLKYQERILETLHQEKEFTISLEKEKEKEKENEKTEIEKAIKKHPSSDEK